MSLMGNGWVAAVGACGAAPVWAKRPPAIEPRRISAQDPCRSLLMYRSLYFNCGAKNNQVPCSPDHTWQPSLKSVDAGIERSVSWCQVEAPFSCNQPMVSIALI